MIFSEDSRVKIPCILHLMRLGYRYLSLKGATWDEETNIFPELFNDAIARINPDLGADDVTRLLTDVKLLLDNEDLGKAFFDRLMERSGARLVDFENFDNNSFHVVTELTCKNGDDEFRPDITLLINGMPLAFIEVKKPNNREGVLAERNRIITRSRNPRFRRFINITQLMVFSNNMEYEDGSPQPIEGAVRGTVRNVSCYDPSAGSGTLLMNIAHAIGEQRCSIYSQDISQKSSSLLRLNLILNNLVHSIPHIIQGNTMLQVTVA